MGKISAAGCTCILSPQKSPPPPVGCNSRGDYQPGKGEMFNFRFMTQLLRVPRYQRAGGLQVFVALVSFLAPSLTPKFRRAAEV